MPPAWWHHGGCRCQHHPAEAARTAPQIPWWSSSAPIATKRNRWIVRACTDEIPDHNKSKCLTSVHSTIWQKIDVLGVFSRDYQPRMWRMKQHKRFVNQTQSWKWKDICHTIGNYHGLQNIVLPPGSKGVHGNSLGPRYSLTEAEILHALVERQHTLTGRELMQMCLNCVGIMGLRDFRNVPFKLGWREYMVPSNIYQSYLS